MFSSSGKTAVLAVHAGENLDGSETGRVGAAIHAVIR
jgi:hypothetical protein